MKATKAQIKQRVELVLKLRILGASFAEIRTFADETDPDSGRPWKVSSRQLWRYVHASDKLLGKSLEKDREKLVNLHLGMRQAMYARAMEGGDYRSALAILKDIDTLLGLYPDSLHELSKKLEMMKSQLEKLGGDKKSLTGHRPLAGAAQGANGSDHAGGKLPAVAGTIPRAAPD